MDRQPPIERVTATPAALAALARLRQQRQFAVWKHTQLIIDVGPGEPEGFSLPAGDDEYFITRSRVFSSAEQSALAEGEGQP
jgi:uncharacterized protein (DUF779 family)